MFRLPILYIDDSEEDARLLELHLHKTGPVALQIFRSAEAAMNYIAGQDTKVAALPRAIWVDVRMPGMNGFDFVRWLRRQEIFAGIPIVMMSSSNHPADLKQGGQTGAQAYVEKFPSGGTLREILFACDAFALDGAKAFDAEWNLLNRGKEARGYSRLF